jgi:hypothetical protein
MSRKGQQDLVGGDEAEEGMEQEQGRAQGQAHLPLTAP